MVKKNGTSVANSSSNATVFAKGIKRQHTPYHHGDHLQYPRGQQVTHGFVAFGVRPKDMAKRNAMLNATTCLFFRFELEGVTMEAVRQSLIEVGTSLVRFLLDPHVLAVERVMSTQGNQYPELLLAFFESGPWATKKWLQEKLEGLARDGHLTLNAPTLAADQLCSMWQGMLVMEVRIGVRQLPSDEEIHRQVSNAVDVFLSVYGKQA